MKPKQAKIIELVKWAVYLENSFIQTGEANRLLF